MSEPSLPNEQTVRACIEEVYICGVALERTKAEFHSFLQSKIAGLASKFSLVPEEEYVVPHFWGDNDGYIDVVWAVGSIPVVAIEIDSALRKKSIRKLLASNSNLQYWVYYGVAPFESFVKSIDITNQIKVIHFPTRFGKLGIKSKVVQSTEDGENQPDRIKKYHVSDIRIKYPSAYEKWSEEQDDILRTCFREGLVVRDIAKRLQRKPGAIRSRIKKLGLH